MALGNPAAHLPRCFTLTLLAMEAEDLMRGQPLDFVVLLSRLRQDHRPSADGRLSVACPRHGDQAAMLVGKYSGADSVRHRVCAGGSPAGRVRITRIVRLRDGSWSVQRHCMTMGTASTMSSMPRPLHASCRPRGSGPRRAVAPRPPSGRPGHLDLVETSDPGPIMT